MTRASETSTSKVSRRARPGIANPRSCLTLAAAVASDLCCYVRGTGDDECVRVWH